MTRLFVTGTDTGVGKTFVSCLIAEAIRGEKIRVGVIKPVETGCEEKNGILIPSDGFALKNASGSHDSIETVVPFRFRTPLAPFMSSLIEKKGISISKIKKTCLKIFKEHELTIIEGAGGLLVPINKNYTYLNLIKDLKADTIIVAGNKLGVINHLMLTIFCLKKNRIRPLLVILNNLSPKKDIAEKTNFTALQKLPVGVPVIELDYNKGEEFKKRILKFFRGSGLI